jgi:nicotine blue oxidoreductase
LDVIAACDPRVVVVGAAGAEVAALLPVDVHVIDNPHHQDGMGSSLRAGLRAVDDVLPAAEIHAALVMLVDLPGVGPAVINRVIAAAGFADTARDAIVRAAFGGRPGHPVIFGRHHWPGVIEAAGGDRGARDYLADHPAVLVECSDIGSGEDVDTQG